jgi:hypothetical protein
MSVRGKVLCQLRFVVDLRNKLGIDTSNLR